MVLPRAASSAQLRPERVPGRINYIGAMSERPRYHANDASRDVLALESHVVQIENVRARAEPPTLAREGFVLVPHASAVRDFRDGAEITARLVPELGLLIRSLSGADAVVVNPMGVLRFGERSPDSGRFNNSRPARFIHVDVSDPTAAAFAERSRPASATRPVRRFAHYNIWRALSEPPQDVPLAVCDARTVGPPDLVPADAVFDVAGQPEWSFEGLVVRYSPAHRWCYYRDMTRAEVLVFKTHDSQAGEPSHVPHSAFDDPSCPAGVTPRSSIEMRAIAYWYG
jgi:hypothetical protein